MNHTISSVFGVEFWNRHRLVFQRARKCDVALCGSTASELCRGNFSYTPNDLDFVAEAGDAMDFAYNLMDYLATKSCHARLGLNSKNKFVPKGANFHVRLTSSFWIPICIFSIPAENFKFFYGKKGLRIQRLADVKKAADELTATDGKPRIAQSLQLDVDAYIAKMAKIGVNPMVKEEVNPAWENFTPNTWDKLTAEWEKNHANKAKIMATMPSDPWNFDQPQKLIATNLEDMNLGQPEPYVKPVLTTPNG